MLGSVATKTLHDYKRPVIYWSAGMFLVALMMMSVYPSVTKSAPQLSTYVENMPEAFKAMFGLQGMDYTSPAGYLNTELFSAWMPMVFAAFAIGAGSRAIAGEQDRGTLDLLMSAPISRRSIVAQKYVAMVADTAILVVALWVSMWICGLLISFDMSTWRILEGCINCGLMALGVGSIALAVGAWRGGRGFSIGVACVVLVGGFFLSSLSQVVDVLKSLRWLSPFYWYGEADVLRSGLDPVDAVVLAGISLVFAAVALVAFERQDLHA